MAELTQKQLEEMVVGKPGEPTVVFFDQPVLDREQSEPGARVYRNQVMVKKTQPGVRDWVAEYAQPADIKKYPEAYARYEQTRTATSKPSISILPGIDPTHLQELIDYGLSTIDVLAEADTLPRHLLPAQRAAKIILEAMEEIEHGEETIEEDIREDGIEAGALPETDRPEHGQPVGRPGLPEVRADSSGDSGGGLPSYRQKHRNQGLAPPDWSVEVTYQ